MVSSSTKQCTQSSEGASSPLDLPFTGRHVQASAWATWIPTLFEPAQFVTTTFKVETSWRSVIRRHGFVVQQVNRKIFGNNWRRHGEGISYVVGIEPQLRGVLHSHAVWDIDFVPYDYLHSLGKSVGGHIDVRPVTSAVGVGYYVAKYAVKSGSVFVYLSRQVEALGNAGLSLT